MNKKLVTLFVVIVILLALGFAWYNLRSHQLQSGLPYGLNPNSAPTAADGTPTYPHPND